MASEKELTNLQRSRDWGRSWNLDMDRLVDEYYAPDCLVKNMLTGGTSQGRDELREAERAMRDLNGPRRMEITRSVAKGDKVALQMDIFWQDRRFKTCAFLTFDTDGRIVADNWYGEGASGRFKQA